MTGDEMQRAIEFLLKNQANFETQIEESNRRFEMQTEETNRQIVQINQIIETLAETQAEFTQTMLSFVTSQIEFNAQTQKRLGELAESQQLTQKEISDLTKAVHNFIKFSSGNGRRPPE